MKCGNCKYLGAESGSYYKTEDSKFHFCENEKSIFKVCLESASACHYFEKEPDKESEE